MSLVAGFFLFGMLMLTASRAEAQTLGGQYNWKGVDQARVDLESEVGNLYNNVLPGLTQGTQNYNNKLAEAYYFRMIHRQIGQGISVPFAVDSALEAISGNTNSASQAGEPNAFSDITVDPLLKQTLKNKAVDLLTI